MSTQVSEALAEFFRDEAGQSLRLVGHYTDDSFDILYLRDDLADEYDDGDFEASFEVHRRDQAAAAEQGEVVQAGDQHCTLRVYDEAIVFNFTQTDDVGTIVSVNPAVGRNLLTFITRSLKQLDANSPQRVEPPDWLAD